MALWYAIICQVPEAETAFNQAVYMRGLSHEDIDSFIKDWTKIEHDMGWCRDPNCKYKKTTMSETNDLEKQARTQRADQRLESVSKYLDEIDVKIREKLRLSYRAYVLEGIAIMGYWAIVTIGLFSGLPFETRISYDFIAFVVLVVSLINSHHANMEFWKVASEWDGAFKILELLGLLRPLSDPRERKRKRSWDEMAEMVKRWFTRKKEVQEKTYASA